MRSRLLRRLFRRRFFSLASFQRTAPLSTILTILAVLTAFATLALPVSAQPSAPVATPVATAPTKLLVDLLEKTDVVWRDGYPTQLTLADVPKAVERLQIAEIRSSRPAFSWVVPAPKRGAAQSAWRIQIATDRSILAESKGAPDVWDSGKTSGAESTAVPFGGPEPLKPSTVYYWRVQIWDETDAPSDWSAIKAFQTAATLDESGASRYPLVKKVDRPQSATPLDDRTTFYDFGRASFGQIRVEIDSKAAGRVALVRVGERVKDGRVDRKPAGSTRYWEYRLPLQTGRQFYSIKTRVDKRNSSGAAVLMPDYVGEVMPFRYAEVEILPASSVKTDKTDKTDATETPADAATAPAEPAEPAQVGSLFDAAPEPVVLSVVRETVTYPFDVSAAYFDCDDDRLNRVWDLCRYSIPATTFAGYYVDGDRERIPYEGDALPNQLSHYCVDREYSLARVTLEYLIFHPTWPTEWHLQIPQIAWFDYLYTGDARHIRRYYEDIKAKTLVALAEDNGLISTRKGKTTPEFFASLHFKGSSSPFGDIVDWPHKGLAGNENAESGETDGFVFNDFNVVVNAYHHVALNSAKRFAEILGEEADAAFFAAQIEKHRKAFHETFFDAERGVYRDGEATDHASLHGNMFPLAFGLVPAENVASVAAFVRSRGMRCSVYGAQFLLDAVYEGNDGEYGFERMTADDLRGWLNMLRVGSTISLEAWDDRYKPNQDWNHAWGAAPANVIPRKLVGVEPTSPGFATLRVKPQIAGLKRVDALVPTIRGPVEVRIARPTDAVYSLAVSLPGNVKADVYVPALSDDDALYVDGVPAAESATGVKFVRDGAFWKAENVGAGVWRFERRAPETAPNAETTGTAETAQNAETSQPQESTRPAEPAQAK
ncbi:MAG: hypothetical protein IJE97_12610 [Thermoguttaceae bacterium]|nr:hypothetical protein [Thermoguttaceae bacterium]